ncbi:unnamed protein product [Polarella glacialis]|uniref:Uncharacterized protein n=1 Tax=Polarella glacialis TaxID=89957 RepID=A0A813EVN1_POLGL|nr:unnamed protein product [Polarella glacialis]CAE8711256.1 unnamed protein product [Polarella glacialis]
MLWQGTPPSLPPSPDRNRAATARTLQLDPATGEGEPHEAGLQDGHQAPGSFRGMVDSGHLPALPAAPGLASRSRISTEDDAEAGAIHFMSAMQKAKAEGLDLFASAPQPSFRSTTPGLHPPHGRATGFVQEPVVAYRLNTCLPLDYFDRRPWTPSTLPDKKFDTVPDKRSLETCARHLRVDVTEDQLLKRVSSKLFLGRRSTTPGVESESRPASRGLSRASYHSGSSRPVSRASVASPCSRRGSRTG